MRLKKGVCGLLLIFLATLNLFAQNDFWKETENLNAVLLKKDLTAAIREAEAAPASDVASLLRRLNLYYRVVDNAKIAATVRQIARAPGVEKNRYLVSEYVKYTVKNEYFRDAETLRIFLQELSFDGDIYGKFIELCKADQTGCNVGDFDNWLAQKAAEARDKNVPDYFELRYFEWIGRRIDWRERFGLDNSEILSQFAAAVRENPSDLETALRYLRFFHKPADAAWLAETFASKHAYDYYELGELLSRDMNYLQRSEDEKRETRQTAARVLLKSLALPYSEEDKSLIVSRRLTYVSIMPRIGNYEKQLRYWTKSALAETYKNLGEAQKAQPIVEELAALDTSDIMTGNTAYLAGMVQDASGARAVEAKILSEQAKRQDSYEYWWERVAYYQGRREPELVFNSYMQSFAAVPFVLNDEKLYSSRLFFIRRFADFVQDEFGYYADQDAKDLSDEQKRKKMFWQETEIFLRVEFERTRSNLRYSQELAGIITGKRFKKLFDEIFSKNPELIVSFAKIKPLSSMDNLLYYFLRSEKVSKPQKDAAMMEILKIAEGSDAKNAWLICETIIAADEAKVYAVRLVPVLLKGLDNAERRLNSTGLNEDDEDYWKSLRDKYLENLFKAYLAANDFKSAEKLILTKYNSSMNYSLWYLAENAAKNGAFADAVRFWKLKANLNRRDLDNLEYLARNAEIKEALREFYRQMKLSEPFSPIPDIALNKLR